MKQLILGIDPGSRFTGYGVVSVQGDKVAHVDHGVITLRESLSMPERLLKLQSQLHNLYTQHPIHTTVVEKVFFGKNADSAFKLGHARGVCLMVAAAFNTRVEEYAARYVKKCVTGSGAASKDHVQMVVFQLLRMRPSAAVQVDASDALSLALTHARVFDVNARLRKAMEGSV